LIHEPSSVELRIFSIEELVPRWELKVPSAVWLLLSLGYRDFVVRECEPSGLGLWEAFTCWLRRALEDLSMAKLEDERA